MALLLGGEGLSKGQPAPDPLEPLPGAKPLVSYHAEVHVSGVIAQRSGVTAAGASGMAVGGNVGGDVISRNRYLRLQGIRSGGKLVSVELEQLYITLRATRQRTYLYPHPLFSKGYS